MRSMMLFQPTIEGERGLVRYLRGLTFLADIQLHLMHFHSFYHYVRIITHLPALFWISAHLLV